MELAFDVFPPPGDREQNVPPVILLHGMMDSRKTWKRIGPQIARKTGRKVYAVDARNHGESPWSDDFNFDILAEDLDHFLNCHQIPRATLVGHSMGGRAALTFALRKPEKVEKLIVEDMTPQNFSVRSSGIVIQMLYLLKESLNAIPRGADETTAKKAVVDFMVKLLPPEQIPVGKRDNYDLDMLPLKRVGDKYSWKTNLSVLESFLNSAERMHQDLSGTFMGEALFLYGTKSFFKVGKDQLIPKLFPEAVKIGFDGAGHLIHHECPDSFVEEVTKFINGYYNQKSKY
ncbi:Abhydrolase domain-containing protein 11, partial [Stegodyphus mimosarum]